MKRALSTAVALATTLSISNVFAAAGESSFTPSSMKTPIRGVLLRNSADGGDFSRGVAVLYACNMPWTARGEDSDGGAGDGGAPGDAAADAGTNDCIVDVADAAALAAAFTSRTAFISPGTYDTLSVMTCMDEGGSQTRFKGSVSLSGTTYYTAAGADPLSTVADDNDYVSVDVSGCMYDYRLAAPITLSDGDEVNVNAFFSIDQIAFARMQGAHGMGGCRSDSGESRSVCTSYPNIIPYIGAVAPSLERYYLTGDLDDTLGTTATGQILFIVDPSGPVIGGFSRRLYSATSGQPFANFDTPLKPVVANGDGTYSVENYGSTATGPGYMGFPMFRRETHNGTFTRPEADAAGGAYRAIRQ